MTITCSLHDDCISSAGDTVVRSLQTMSSVRYFRPFWRKPGRATLTTLYMNFTATYLRTWNAILMQYVSLCKTGLNRASVLHTAFQLHQEPCLLSMAWLYHYMIKLCVVLLQWWTDVMGVALVRSSSFYTFALSSKFMHRLTCGV